MIAEQSACSFDCARRIACIHLSAVVAATWRTTIDTRPQTAVEAGRFSTTADDSRRGETARSLPARRVAGRRPRARFPILADQKRKTDTPLEKPAESKPAADLGRLQRVMRFFGNLRSWATGHWLRSVLVAAVILVLIASTMAGWAYLASVALRSGEISIDVALDAFDKGRYEEARACVGQDAQKWTYSRSKYGGPLFVLGAIKSHDAEEESAADRRRIEYLVASRYLKEANTYGLPAGRELDGLYLLGKSLVESSQFDEGIRVLNELLGDYNSRTITRWRGRRIACYPIRIC